MGVLSSLEPKCFFEKFEMLSSIPRGSTHEKEISNHLKKWAEDLGLYVEQDNYYNLLIKKPGSKGYENAKPLILHGHMDMVLAKDEGVDIDLLKEGPHLVLDGDVVRAEGTTLGADNGVGVSYILCILESQDIAHPPIEAIITAQEEIGKVGATVFDAKNTSARRLIDLNWHNDQSIYAGCAGDIACWMNVPVVSEHVSDNLDFCSIEICDCEGGHQGFDTHRQRINALQQYFRIIDKIAENYEVHLSSDTYGGVDKGVIPNGIKAVIAFNKDDATPIKTIIEELAETIKREYEKPDPRLKIKVERAEKKELVLTYNDTKKICSVASLIPCGVYSMCLGYEDLVESSSAISVVKAQENTFGFMVYIASMVSSRKYDIYKKLKNLGEYVNAEFKVFVDCPEWTYRPDSSLLNTAKVAFRKVMGHEPEIELSHSSLEIGLFEKKIQGIEMISLGPKAYDLHTTRERFEWKTVAPTWELIKEVLKNLND